MMYHKFDKPQTHTCCEQLIARVHKRTAVFLYSILLHVCRS